MLVHVFSFFGHTWVSPKKQINKYLYIVAKQLFPLKIKKYLYMVAKGLFPLKKSNVCPSYVYYVTVVWLWYEDVQDDWSFFACLYAEYFKCF